MNSCIVGKTCVNQKHRIIRFHFQVVLAALCVALVVARPQGGGGGGGGGKSGGGFITPVDIHKETEIHFKVST